MSVKEYYFKHFSELKPEKQFHFAIRMKNYLKLHDFDDFLKNNQPNTDLSKILLNNNFSNVNNYTKRKPFFEKYKGLYGIEATLFRVHHLLLEYNIDLRNDFQENYNLSSLYKLVDELENDDEALKTLSTWAINTIYLTEELFPRNRNVIDKLAKWALEANSSEMDPASFVYLCTHIIICKSGFYIKDLAEQKNLKLLRKLLQKSAEIIEKNIETISLDACVEFLVCSDMVGFKCDSLRNIIGDICDSYLEKAPYLINYRRDSSPTSYFHTLDGAEHINALYIMSGLDKSIHHK